MRTRTRIPKLVEMLALKPPIQNGVVSSYDYSYLASTASRHSPQSWDASNTPMRINPEGQNSMQHMASWKISAQPCYLAFAFTSSEFLIVSSVKAKNGFNTRL